jgi:hypothetical protein
MGKAIVVLILTVGFGIIIAPQLLELRNQISKIGDYGCQLRGR